MLLAFPDARHAESDPLTSENWVAPPYLSGQPQRKYPPCKNPMECRESYSLLKNICFSARNVRDGQFNSSFPGFGGLSEQGAKRSSNGRFSSSLEQFLVSLCCNEGMKSIHLSALHIVVFFAGIAEPC